MGLAFDLIDPPHVCTAPAPGWSASSGICTTTPPVPGSGLREDGRGWVHIPEAGIYVFFGATANRLPEGTPLYVKEGGAVSLQATSSRIEWIGPRWPRQRIPQDLLYPPFQ